MVSFKSILLSVYIPKIYEESFPSPSWIASQQSSMYIPSFKTAQAEFCCAVVVFVSGGAGSMCLSARIHSRFSLKHFRYFCNQSSKEFASDIVYNTLIVTLGSCSLSPESKGCKYIPDN